MPLRERGFPEIAEPIATCGGEAISHAVPFRVASLQIWCRCVLGAWHTRLGFPDAAHKCDVTCHDAIGREFSGPMQSQSHFTASCVESSSSGGRDISLPEYGNSIPFAR